MISSLQTENLGLREIRQLSQDQELGLEETEWILTSMM